MSSKIWVVVEVKLKNAKEKSCHHLKTGNHKDTRTKNFNCKRETWILKRTIGGVLNLKFRLNKMVRYGPVNSNQCCGFTTW